MGYASVALELIKTFARDSLGLHTLAAIAASDNTPSVRLFTRCGFRKSGILTGWLRIEGDTYADAVLFHSTLQ